MSTTFSRVHLCHEFSRVLRPLRLSLCLILPAPLCFLPPLQWKDEKDTIKDFVKKKKVQPMHFGHHSEVLGKSMNLIVVSHWWRAVSG